MYIAPLENSFFGTLTVFYKLVFKILSFGFIKYYIDANMIEAETYKVLLDE